MKTFLLIWVGQFISQIGTALTRFALLLWVYQLCRGAHLLRHLADAAPGAQRWR